VLRGEAPQPPARLHAREHRLPMRPIPAATASAAAAAATTISSLARTIDRGPAACQCAVLPRNSRVPSAQAPRHGALQPLCDRLLLWILIGHCFVAEPGW